MWSSWAEWFYNHAVLMCIKWHVSPLPTRTCAVAYVRGVITKEKMFSSKKVPQLVVCSQPGVGVTPGQRRRRCPGVTPTPGVPPSRGTSHCRKRSCGNRLWLMAAPEQPSILSWRRDYHGRFTREHSRDRRCTGTEGIRKYKHQRWLGLFSFLYRGLYWDYKQLSLVSRDGRLLSYS